MFLREEVSLRTGSIIVLVEQLLDFFGVLEKKTDLQGR